MKNNLNQLIIIGGGASIKEGLAYNLWNKIKNRFTIGCNFAYHFSEFTILTYVDSSFYNKNIEDLGKIPLIIGQGKKLDEKLNNTLTIPCISNYNRDLKKGIYKSSLVGIYSLSLGINLLDEGIIFLLGFDYGAQEIDKKNRPLSHFYQNEIEHRGIGKIKWYAMEGRADKDFGIYKNESKIKIYNVSPLSKINTFEKIDYNTFFKLLDNNQYDQNTLRSYIKEKLKFISS